MASNVYIAIDLKSYYASVECVQRHQNPLTFNLLVADESRTDKTICLAVSPSLKAMGVGSRPRLFEAKEAIRLYEAQGIPAKTRIGIPAAGLCFDADFEPFAIRTFRLKDGRMLHEYTMIRTMEKE